MALQNEQLASPPYVIVYDSTCHFCSRLKDWILLRVVDDTIEVVDNQDRALMERFEQLNMIDCHNQMVLILPSGKLVFGADAVYHITTQLRFYKYIAFCYWIPGINLLCNLMYKWITKNRHNWQRNCDGCHKNV